MNDTKSYIQSLFTNKGIALEANKAALLDEFVLDNDNITAVNVILYTQQQLMDKWKLKSRIADIIAQPIIISNATEGKPYQSIIDLVKLKLDDLIVEEYTGLQELGLLYNQKSCSIEGTPIVSGDVKFTLHFLVNGEPEDAPKNVKTISITINPDAKMLWKDIPSDKHAIFWKEDDVCIADKLGEKNIVISSKRGRSHKNVGSFRDDDFAYKHFEDTGWSLVAVADGAGSATLARKGAQLATKAVIEYFEQKMDSEKADELDNKLKAYHLESDPSLFKDIEILAKQNLYKVTVYVHNKIKEHADATFISNPELFTNLKAKSKIEYYHSTLIFTLFKKFDIGYVVLTFGVGDCPIAMMNMEKSDTKLLNWLDVGEFGGGTRFITQPDIFHSKENPMASRLNINIVKDFSYLFLMTDGIYDPKFVVEANLEKNENWLAFLADLQGENEDHTEVDFTPTNIHIANQLDKWMDFWSTGNHDDRTLAIIF